MLKDSNQAQKLSFEDGAFDFWSIFKMMPSYMPSQRTLLKKILSTFEVTFLDYFWISFELAFFPSLSTSLPLEAFLRFFDFCRLLVLKKMFVIVFVVNYCSILILQLRKWEVSFVGFRYENPWKEEKDMSLIHVRASGACWRW